MPLFPFYLTFGLTFISVCAVSYSEAGWVGLFYMIAYWLAAIVMLAVFVTVGGAISYLLAERRDKRWRADIARKIAEREAAGHPLCVKRD